MLLLMSLLCAISADFGQVTGHVRPELHSSGFGPTICGQNDRDLADLKSMNFALARTHDWALVNPNQRVCDWHHIFPLVKLDAKDPNNYVFGPTDYLLERTRTDAGLEVFFRLGTSIEHSGHHVHFNSLIPEDFDKVAEVFAGTVRHYNRGWASGHKWNIRYWELWNEPDGRHNMWCLPEGDGDNKEEENERDLRRRELFVRFFVTALKRLKSEFGDEIKVGGPALCGYNLFWFKPILEACKQAGVAPDFISWHGYTDDPMKFNRDAEEGRRLLDGYGFTKCEMIVNEWHYFGYADYTWPELQFSADPEVKNRIWNGPRGHNSIHSAAMVLSTLANLQRSRLSQAYYYGCRHTGAWGFKDEKQAKYKVFYALKLFGDIVRDYPIICASTNEGTLTTLAVKSANGKPALLIADYGGKASTISVPVKGLAATAKAKATVLDHTHELTEHPVEFSDGILKLKKNDGNSAAFFVEFE